MSLSTKVPDQAKLLSPQAGCRSTCWDGYRYPSDTQGPALQLRRYSTRVVRVARDERQVIRETELST